MLKEILSIGGKPGLFKLVSQGKNMLIVESLVDGKRMPAYSRDKVVSLGDIAMFTETDEVPLAEVLDNVLKKENGKEASIDPKSGNDVLRSYMAEVLPEYDKDRVYPSDIRKLVSWYNLLIKNNITDFKQAEPADEKAEEVGESEPKKEVAEEKKTPKTTKKAAPKK
ncbi:hypothetical protein D0T49_09315 [Paludibacter sp. 221]|uniref:DUF5606 family protein n=1 Tax=Paludibacter sp. 221 TaxID=2302939 RepID=UPI0013D30231|nr:DUF5606 domain-containing protein [Paludibacter sp. 221]NDV47242.1 hypothetical protein [Paludibacter sp. 221]